MKKTSAMIIVILASQFYGYAQDDSLDEAPQVALEKKVAVKKNSLHPTVLKKLFINSLDTPIKILVTDKKDKQTCYVIPAGTERFFDYMPDQTKKIDYSGRYYEKNVAIALAKLKDNAVIVFSLDNKLEFFNFIDIRQKNIAINDAKNALHKACLAIPRNTQLIRELDDKIYELQEQTIYRL